MLPRTGSVLLVFALALGCNDSDNDPAQTSSEGSSEGSSSTSDGTPSGDSTAAAGSSSASTDTTTSEGSSTTSSQTEDPLALLAEGPHIGMLTSFEAPAEGTQDAVDELWLDAMQAGMDVARIQVDWADLEPQPGVYDTAALEAELAAYDELGLQVMVTLSTIDSFEFTLPPDLEDPDDPRGLVGGLAFDDEAITSRFAGLLDEVVPLVVQHGGYLLTVGNEPDNAFEDTPGFAAEVAGFTAAAKQHAASIDDRLAISMTLAYSAASENAEVSEAILDVVDVVTFNLYCQNEGGLVVDAKESLARIQAVLTAAGDKPVVIQELGCPAGYEEEPTNIDGSLEKQAVFFEVFADAMRNEPRLRSAYVFQTFDWSPALTASLAEEMEASGFDAATINFMTESLGTVGLCRWTDASCRPAWNQFLEDLATL
jgi:hypothetical protein